MVYAASRGPSAIPATARSAQTLGLIAVHLRFSTKSWPAITSFYRGLIDQHGWKIEPMLDLVEYVSRSPYATSLFAATSHDQLHIGRVQDFVCGDNDLTVAFDPNTRQFLFSFQQREDDLHPWSTNCAEGEWQQSFQRVLHKRLRWFHEG